MRDFHDKVCLKQTRIDFHDKVCLKQSRIDAFCHFSSFSRMLCDSTPHFVSPSLRWSVHPSVTLYFLVATLHPTLSVHWSVGPLVLQSVTLYFFGGFAVFGIPAPAQMMK